VLRLSSYPITAYDLLVSGGRTERLRAELAAEAVVQAVDVAVEQATLWRRARRWSFWTWTPRWSAAR
jgi:phosphoserine phosphatase